MTGPVLMVIVLVVGFPLLFMVSGALVSVILGHVLWRGGVKRFRGDEARGVKPMTWRSTARLARRIGRSTVATLRW